MGCSSIAAFSLCLLCLLGNWQTGQAKKTADIKLDAVEQNMQTVNCKKGELIHITTAIWSGFDKACPKRRDETKKIRSRCENRQKCSFIPHWKRSKAPHVKLGDLCYGHPEILKGNAECWNPCLGKSCGEGGNCTPSTYNTYKCACDKGYSNAGGKSDAACTKSKKTKDIKFKVREKRRQNLGCDKGEVIHINNAVWFASHLFCHKSADRTDRVRSRCEGHQKCSFIPHWMKNDALHLKLGDLCYGYKETLKGNAECWNPCNGVDCGEGGKCERVTHNTHKCACGQGYENADDKADGVCKKSKRIRVIKMVVYQRESQTIECGEGGVIHIKSAVWSSFNSSCPKADKTETLRYRCEGLQSCKFIPHWSLDYLHSINLGEPCGGQDKKLKFEAECWNPCNDVSCEEGVCVPSTFKTHKCEKRDSRHTKTIRVANMETETEVLNCKEGELIHIESVIWSGFVPHCNEKVDVTEKVRERCGNHQKCEFIPLWFQEEGSLLLQSNCSKTGEYIRGEAQCWNPCLGAECGEGKRCAPLTYNTHKCQ